jgi:hypothetical protein
MPVYPGAPPHFPPPRLQLVAFEQDPDCLPTDAGNQFALDSLLDHQAHRPTRPAFRRFATDHGDDALLLSGVENLLGSRSLLVVDGAIQGTPVIATGNMADCLGSNGKCLRDLRRSVTVGKLA